MGHAHAATDTREFALPSGFIDFILCNLYIGDGRTVNNKNNNEFFTSGHSRDGILLKNS